MAWNAFCFLTGTRPVACPDGRFSAGLDSVTEESDEDCTIGINQVLGEDLGDFAESRTTPNPSASVRPAPKDSALGHAGLRQDERPHQNIGSG